MQRAMSVSTSSRVWSCATLRDGVDDVAAKRRELEEEEAELERQIEDRNLCINCFSEVEKIST